MTRLILIRHGQSMGNLERRFLGHTDLGLTPMGHEQARRVAEYLRPEPIEAIYSSDLSRAYDTARPTAEEKGLEIRCETDLREIFAGEWEDDSFRHINEVWGEAFHTFRSDIGHACPPGGEPTLHVGERVYACIRRIAEENPDKTVAVVSHATAIGMFTARVMGLNADTAKRVALPSNASCSLFEYRDGEFILRQYSVDAYLGETRLKAPPTA